jgi:hypothetical protein
MESGFLKNKEGCGHGYILNKLFVYPNAIQKGIKAFLVLWSALSLLSLLAGSSHILESLLITTRNLVIMRQTYLLKHGRC